MARIKGAMMTRKRRKKVLKLAKGYYGSKSKHFKMAKQQVMKGGNIQQIGTPQDIYNEPNNAFVWGRNAFSISSSGASASTKVHSMPNFFSVTANRFTVPP